MKSVLQYPGGKTRAAKMIADLIPSSIKTIVSPFLGGGSVEFELASRGCLIKGSDAFPPLIDFYKCLANNPAKLADLVESFYPLSREAFYALQKTEAGTDPFNSAARFFVLNRSSFSGSTLSGGMSPGHPRFTLSAINRLRTFRFPEGFTADLLDFQEAISRTKEFIYADPPYLIKPKIYGIRGDQHKGFDHEGLASLLNARNGWILSYNDSPEVRNLYKQRRIESVSWSYGMSGKDKRKDRSELLIFSDDIEKITAS